MSRFLQKEGICKVILNPSEGLVINPGEEQTEFLLNQSEAWSLPSAGIRQIRVVAHEELSYVPSPHVAYIADLFEQLGIAKGSCVDIGAYDGLNFSHTIDLFRRGWSGLAIECQPARFARLAEVYRVFKQAEAARFRVTPTNIVPLLTAYGLPHNFDFLNLDIDSYDYYVLEALLQAYRPKVICTEINEVIPPPVRFAAHYHPDFVFDPYHRFYGQSLAMAADLGHRHGYVCLRLQNMDLFLIDVSLTQGSEPELATLYRQGVSERPKPPHFDFYPFDVDKLWQATPEDALALIHQAWPDVEQYHSGLEALP